MVGYFDLSMELISGNDCVLHKSNTPFHEKHKTKGCNPCLEVRQSVRQWCVQPKPRFHFKVLKSNEKDKVSLKLCTCNKLKNITKQSDVIRENFQGRHAFIFIQFRVVMQGDC